MIPQNQNEQLLAIPINDQSKPVQFSMDQLHLCKQVKSLFLCDNAKLNIQPTNKSCSIALAHKQYLDAVHLCKFTIFRPNKLLYQIQLNQYFLYLAKHQYPIYNYNRNNWSRSIPARISLLTIHVECDLNLKEHQIKSQAYTNFQPVIEHFNISSVSSNFRKSSIQTQTIVKLIAFCTLSLMSIITI